MQENSKTIFTHKRGVKSVAYSYILTTIVMLFGAFVALIDPDNRLSSTFSYILFSIFLIGAITSLYKVYFSFKYNSEYWELKVTSKIFSYSVPKYLKEDSFNINIEDIKHILIKRVDINSELYDRYFIALKNGKQIEIPYGDNGLNIDKLLNRLKTINLKVKDSFD